MQRGLAGLFCTTAILLAGCALHSAARLEKRANEKEARIAALHWLQLLDNGDYEEAFEWEALDFRIVRTQKQFVRYMEARRQPFGPVVSRNVLGAASMTKLVGLPEGKYESIIFKTAFEKKSQTAERVILVKQDAGWRV